MTTKAKEKRRIGSVRRRISRRGIALVLVLALLAITLGFSYALLRSHTTDHELERNQSRKTDARTAAQAGVAVALRKLYDGTWAGADTSFTGDLTADKLQGFAVTYATGDSELTSASADWKEYPFRVTILSKGYSIDPSTAASRSEYSIRVVVQLIRRKLNTNQASTPGLDAMSICQVGSDDAEIQHPIRLNDNVYIQGEIEFSKDYPQEYGGTAYLAFFDDIYDMYRDFGWDYRPFSGRLFTPSSRQPIDGDVVRVLDAALRVPRTDVAIVSTPLVPPISSFSGYRLYDKGKKYSGQALTVAPDTLDSVPNAEYLVSGGSYAADPQTNPLGVFTNTQGSVGFGANASFEGMLIAYGSGSASDVHIGGTNVSIQAPTLPALSGDATSYRLPAMVADDDVRIYDGTNRTINGWVVCSDEFELDSGVATSTVTVTGGVFCKKLSLQGRSSWVQSQTNWQSAYTAWNSALLKLGQNIYFPGWLNNNRPSWGIYLTPRLIFSATPSGVTNHVPDFSQPIYVPHTEDGGLRWDVVKWQELGAS
jgi:Tfp pilus assembly protein PilX